MGDRHPKVNDNVLIGANATILGNISIGKGAQVAAGSLVLKDVPPRTMVAGSPAKEVGKVTGEPLSLTMSSERTHLQVFPHLIPYSLSFQPVVAHQTSWSKSTGEYDIAVLSRYTSRTCFWYMTSTEGSDLNLGATHRCSHLTSAFLMQVCSCCRH